MLADNIQIKEPDSIVDILKATTVLFQLNLSLYSGKLAR